MAIQPIHIREIKTETSETELTSFGGVGAELL